VKTTESNTWHERAQAVIPGGVSSPVRAFKAVGGTPRYFVSGNGSKVVDADGNSYLDLVGSWGPMILGHAHPEVVARVSETLKHSFSFGAPHPNESLLAEAITQRVSAAERVRFVSSGTEAVMTALRLARGATGRDLIVKFSGCYHGHSDSMLVAAGSGVATLGLPNSPGVTKGQVADTVVLEYNDEESLDELFSQRGDKIAGVITESAAANMGAVPPNPGFNKRISELCQRHGALMILDEVMTGFRVSAAGWWGKYGTEESWQPDLFTYGKVIGGGLPLAAVAGRKEVMNLLAPAGNIYQAGTLSGNPVATSAGLATLALLDKASYQLLNRRASEIGSGISDALRKFEIPHSYQTAGNLFSFFLGSGVVTNYTEAAMQNTEWFRIFFNTMLDSGVSIPPSAFEAWFVSTAISDEDVAHILLAAEKAAKTLAEQIHF
jgi:glutamate-1-semialdehyde 2,1-aminomutase